MPMLTSEEFLTVKEAAERLGVAPNTVRAWGANGKIPEYRHSLNNYRLFKVSDVEKLSKQIESPIRRRIKTNPK